MLKEPLLNNKMTNNIEETKNELNINNNYQVDYNMKNSYTFKTYNDIKIQLLIEWHILKYERWAIFIGFLFQYLHSVATNFVYYLSDNLNDTQRHRLYDLGFKAMPNSSGFNKEWNNIIVNTFFIMCSLLLLSLIFTNLRPSKNETGCLGIGFINAKSQRDIGQVQPNESILLRIRSCFPRCREASISFIIVLKRILIVTSVLLTLRSINFLITILPSPAEHCSVGSNEWNPPNTISEILFRVDTTHGCGDLLFSSHTLYCTTILLVTFKYFYWANLKRFLAILLFGLIPAILAARKHYSIDIFGSLYTTPLVWMLVETLWPDPKSFKKYNILIVDDGYGVLINDEHFHLDNKKHFKLEPFDDNYIHENPVINNNKDDINPAIDDDIENNTLKNNFYLTESKEI